jgi:hypothetical protein
MRFSDLLKCIDLSGRAVSGCTKGQSQGIFAETCDAHFAILAVEMIIVLDLS